MQRPHIYKREIGINQPTSTTYNYQTSSTFNKHALLDSKYHHPSSQQSQQYYHYNKPHYSPSSNANYLPATEFVRKHSRSYVNTKDNFKFYQTSSSHASNYSYDDQNYWKETYGQVLLTLQKCVNETLTKFEVHYDESNRDRLDDVLKGEIDEMFNQLQRCLTSVTNYSESHSYYQLGAQFLSKIYTLKNQHFMSRFFTEGQQKAVQRAAYTIAEYNKFTQGLIKLDQVKFHDWPRVLLHTFRSVKVDLKVQSSIEKQQVEPDSSSVCSNNDVQDKHANCSVSLMILRVWYQQMIQTGGPASMPNPEEFALIDLAYSIYQTQTKSYCNEIDIKAVQEVICFFKWLLLEPSFDELFEKAVRNDKSGNFADLQSYQVTSYENPERIISLQQSTSCRTESMKKLMKMTISTALQFSETESVAAIFTRLEQKETLQNIVTSQKVFQFIKSNLNHAAADCLNDKWEIINQKIKEEEKNLEDPVLVKKTIQRIKIKIERIFKQQSQNYRLSVKDINEFNYQLRNLVVPTTNSFVDRKNQEINERVATSEDNNNVDSEQDHPTAPIERSSINQWIDQIVSEEQPTEIQINNCSTIVEGIVQILKTNNFMSESPWQLIIFGSALNSICTKSCSDLDLALVINLGHDHYNLLEQIKQILENSAEPKRFLDCQIMFLVSGAILQLKDQKTGTEIDIGINKVLEIQNSLLINQYALLDNRFRKLALILKIWNKRFFEDKRKRMNSYTITLMLIAHMVAIGVLPHKQSTQKQIQQQFDAGNYWQGGKFAQSQVEEHFIVYEHQGRDVSYTSVCDIAYTLDKPVETSYSSSQGSSENSSLSFQNLNCKEKTTTGGLQEDEILLSFFRFFAREFDEEKFALDIRSANPFVPRSCILDEIYNLYNQSQNQQLKESGDLILREQHIQKNDSLFYYVVDPFRLDYCPAKIRKESELARQFKNQLSESLENLIQGDNLF